MTLSSGTRLGPYEVLSQLGRGGMGEVWRARDTRLDREVAIKLLSCEMAGPEALERFKREAKAASALNHPHICVVHDIGEHEGRPFLVMERLKGETLREAIGGKPMPVQRVLELGAQIADALEAAHGAGIVHRDIKPANVFVTARGDASFSTSAWRSRSGGAGADRDGCRDGCCGGAPDEPGLDARHGGLHVARAGAGRRAGREDRSLLARRASLYEMATGRLPFVGRTSAEIYDGILNGSPAPPSSVTSAVPPDLDRIILKALEKDRGLRYQHASDLKADLRRLMRDSMSGKSSAIASGSVPRRPSRRALAAGVGAAALVLVLSGAWYVRRKSTPPAAAPAPAVKRIAVLPFENLGAAEDEYFADGMADEIRGKLTSLLASR